MSHTLVRGAGLAVRAGALAYLVAHFALTAAYVAPLNPARIRLDPILQATVGRFFSQSWSLFAPEPMSTNLELHVRCLDGAGVEAALAGREDGDGGGGGDDGDGAWADLTGPLYAAFQRNRFSAYDRLARPVTNSMRQYMAGPAGLAPLRVACGKGDAEACRRFQIALSLARDDARRHFVAAASMYCKDVGRADATAVAMRLVERAAVPWSERGAAEPRVRVFELGVAPLDRTIASAGVFRRGS